MALHDITYQHWKGRHLGIWRRRATIAGNGLTGCMKSRWMRYLVTAAWLACLVQILLLFSLGQLLVTDSMAVRWLGQLNPQLQSIGNSLVNWLVQQPEISVHTSYNLLFYYFSKHLMTLSLLAVALAIPHLITRDLSSRAILVYSSKAINRLDYFLGKFAAIFGLLALVWLGPVVAAWFFGNLLSTDWHFFWHSRRALGNCLLYILCGMTVLSILGMAISAVSTKEKATVALWVSWWVIGNALIAISHQTKPWLRHLSFRFNLDQISAATFRLRNDLDIARENLPLFGQMMRNARRQTETALDQPEVAGAVTALVIMLVLSAIMLRWRVKPE